MLFQWLDVCFSLVMIVLAILVAILSKRTLLSTRLLREQIMRRELQEAAARARRSHKTTPIAGANGTRQRSA